MFADKKIKFLQNVENSVEYVEIRILFLRRIAQPGKASKTLMDQRGFTPRT